VSNLGILKFVLRKLEESFSFSVKRLFFLFHHILTTSGDKWLGMNLLEIFWTDGSEFYYQAWDHQQPNPDGLCVTQHNTSSVRLCSSIK
jgi:hypothetical protein